MTFQPMVKIWAQTPDCVIGADNAIPCRLSEDTAPFKAATLGHGVVATAGGPYQHGMGDRWR